MRTVYKYTIGLDKEDTIIQTAKDGKVVGVEVNPGEPETVMFWVELKLGDEIISRRFKIFGTGHQVPDGYSFCGMVRDPVTMLVWHLYEFLGTER